jgi:predicted lipoprotein with Yx(FWY)xxD motif
LALVAAACGSDAEPNAAVTDTAAPAAAAAPAADQPATIDVLAGSSDLGEILVGPDGLTLYGFTNDVNAASTCYGTCADAWPPVIVSDDWTAGPGLDFGIFATTVREDGQSQLVAGKWPLYWFAGDAVPGDVNGQGSGDVWFAVDLDGKLIGVDGESSAAPAEEAAPAEQAGPIVGTGATELGDALVDAAGLTLYGFLPDRDAGAPTCNDACADAWPPIIVEGGQIPAGLDPELFSLMPRDDGSMQLAAGIWPLYLFAGDAAPGDVNGQGSGDVWFVAAPDGKLIGASAASGDAAPATEAEEDDGY